MRKKTAALNFLRSMLKAWLKANVFIIYIMLQTYGCLVPGIWRAYRFIGFVGCGPGAKNTGIEKRARTTPICMGSNMQTGAMRVDSRFFIVGSNSNRQVLCVVHNN